MNRERTYQWQNPMTTAQGIRQMSGLDALQAMIEGHIPSPPIASTLGFQLAEVAEGHALFTIKPQEYHYNPIGSMHGGVIAALLDSAAGCAIHTMLPKGVGYTTVELKINYIRAITVPMDTLDCIGEIIHNGRRIATASAKLQNQAGKLYAHATTTCLIFPIEDKQK